MIRDSDILLKKYGMNRNLFLYEVIGVSPDENKGEIYEQLLFHRN